MNLDLLETSSPVVELVGLLTDKPGMRANCAQRTSQKERVCLIRASRSIQFSCCNRASSS